VPVNTEHTECTEPKPLASAEAARNTTFNAEAAEAAEKNLIKTLRSLRALRSNVVIPFHGVWPAHNDSVVDEFPPIHGVIRRAC